MRVSNGGLCGFSAASETETVKKHHISALSVSMLTSNSYAADFSVDFPLKENPWRAALRRRHTQWQKDIALLSVAFSSALQGALRMLGSSVLCGSLAASERFKAGTDAKPSHRQRRSALQAGIFIQSRFEWRDSVDFPQKANPTETGTGLTPCEISRTRSPARLRETFRRPAESGDAPLRTASFHKTKRRAVSTHGAAL